MNRLYFNKKNHYFIPNQEMSGEFDPEMSIVSQVIDYLRRGIGVSRVEILGLDRADSEDGIEDALLNDNASVPLVYIQRVSNAPFPRQASLMRVPANAIPIDEFRESGIPYDRVNGFLLGADLGLLVERPAIRSRSRR